MFDLLPTELYNAVDKIQSMMGSSANLAVGSIRPMSVFPSGTWCVHVPEDFARKSQTEVEGYLRLALLSTSLCVSQVRRVNAPTLTVSCLVHLRNRKLNLQLEVFLICKGDVSTNSKSGATVLVRSKIVSFTSKT